MNSLNNIQRPLWLAEVESLGILAPDHMSPAAAHAFQQIQVLDHAGWFCRSLFGRRTTSVPVIIDRRRLAELQQRVFGTQTPLSETEQQIRAILDERCVQRYRRAISEEYLEPGHPFLEGAAPEGEDYVSTDVISHVEGAAPLLHHYHTTIQALADFLDLEAKVLRAVIKHRGVKELLQRAKMIHETHLEPYQSTMQWSLPKARSCAIFADIIWDNPDISADELADYAIALEEPLHYSPEKRMLVMGQGVKAGESTSGEVTMRLMEALESQGTDHTSLTRRMVICKTLVNALAEFEARYATNIAGFPYVTGAEEVFCNNSTSTIISELLMGGAFHRENPNLTSLPLSKQWRIMLQILIGLHKIHEQCVHCDIKPSNVLLTKVGDTYEPRIIDFGLASDIGVALTYTGDPLYEAPENLYAGTTKSYQPSKDYYAAGIMALETLMGIEPSWFFVDTLDKLKCKLYFELPELPAHIHAACPELPLEIREGVIALVRVAATDRDIIKAIDLLRQGIAILEAREQQSLPSPIAASSSARH